MERKRNTDIYMTNGAFKKHLKMKLCHFIKMNGNRDYLNMSNSRETNISCPLNEDSGICITKK